MSKRQRSIVTTARDKALDLSHLRREARTSLELALIALAPSPVIDELAASAGLLEALAELPPSSPPAAALVPKVVKRAREALDAWQDWQATNVVRGSA